MPNQPITTSAQWWKRWRELQTGNRDNQSYWRERALHAKTVPDGESLTEQIVRARTLLRDNLTKMALEGSPLYEAAEELEDVITILDAVEDRLRLSTKRTRTPAPYSNNYSDSED